MLKIITTSSLIPRNGIDTLIEACGLLRLNFELTIAGDGPQKDQLENRVIKLGIINRVKFLGRVTPSQIPGLLKDSHLFVRSSRFEGFGNSFIEAMAAGIPVIGTAVGGIPDFLFDGKTGFIVPVDDPKALAEKIKFVAENDNKKIILEAKKLVRDTYDWDIIAKKVLKEMFACL